MPEEKRMTPKEKIQEFVARMPDAVSMDQVIYKLNLFCSAETGLAEADRGEGMDHDEFFDELLAECDEDIKSFESVQKTLAKVQGGTLTGIKDQVMDLAKRMDGQTSFEQVVYQIDVLRHHQRVDQAN